MGIRRSCGHAITLSRGEQAVLLWAGAGAPAHTVRRAAVRKRGPALILAHTTNFPNDYG